MTEDANNNSIKADVLKAIKDGQVKMRPKWQFITKAALLIVGVVLVALTILYLVSFIVFVLRQTGLLFVPGFGPQSKYWHKRAGFAMRVEFLILSGHTWHAYSPSMFELATHPIQLVYNGQAWYLGFNGSFANARPWPSRDAAAADSRRISSHRGGFPCFRSSKGKPSVPSSTDPVTPSHNTDACDVSGTKILIENCDISTGDDDYTCGGGTHDVLITNNTYGNGHGISIGSYTDGGVSNFLVINCSFTGTDNGNTCRPKWSWAAFRTPSKSTFSLSSALTTIIFGMPYRVA